MHVEVTEHGLLIPKELLEGIDEVEIRQEQHRLVIVPVPSDDQPQNAEQSSGMQQAAHIAQPERVAQPEQPLIVDKDVIAAQLAEFDRIAALISAAWPTGVSAVDAVRDVRRDL